MRPMWEKILCTTAVLAVGGTLYKTLPLIRIRPQKERLIKGKRYIACIGDSITFGAGVTWHRKRKAWPYVLNRLLGDSFQVLNYGISGATALLDSETVFKEHDFLEDAFSACPELILMMLGTNDAKTVNWKPREFRRDYTLMIDRIRKGTPDALLVLMTPPSTYPEKKTGLVACGIDGKIVHEQAVPAVREIAKQQSLPLIDLHSFMDGHPDWFGDGVHPNAEGNRQIAGYILEAINGMLAA